MASFNLEKFKKARDQSIKQARLVYDASKRPKYIGGKPFVNNKPIVPIASNRGGCGCGRRK